MPKLFLFVLLFIASASWLCAEEIRLLSYNVRHATDMDGKPALERQAAIINKSKADIVGLQEIDQSCKRSGSVDQPVVFGALTKRASYFGAAMDYDGGRYGMAMLSKLKVIQHHVHKLPGGQEPRVAVVLEVETADKHRVLIANVHFDWTSEKLRGPQATSLIGYLDKCGLPAIVLGDYNAEPKSKTIQIFREAGFRFMEKPKGHSFTSNARNPTADIDHIALRDGGQIRLIAGSIAVLEEPQASDHRPVLGTVRIEKRD